MPYKHGEQSSWLPHSALSVVCIHHASAGELKTGRPWTPSLTKSVSLCNKKACAGPNSDMQSGGVEQRTQKETHMAALSDSHLSVLADLFLLSPSSFCFFGFFFSSEGVKSIH